MSQQTIRAAITIEQLKSGIGPVRLDVLLSEKKLLKKKNGGDYLSVTVRDQTGVLTFPIWASAKERFETLEEGEVYYFYCDSVGEYDFLPQPSITGIELHEGVDPMTYQDVYDIRTHTAYLNKAIAELDAPYEEFVWACIGGVGFENFAMAPGAIHHHHNKLGGLLYHTVGMLKTFDMLCALYGMESICVSRLRAKIILHDIMKTKEYLYPIIAYNTEAPFSHKEMGMLLIQTVNDRTKLLSAEELGNMQAGILVHHGHYDGHEIQDKEDMLLHLLDMIDSRLVDQRELDLTEDILPCVSEAERIRKEIETEGIAAILKRKSEE